MKQISGIEKFRANLLREYWEYRKMIWGIPMVMSALIVLAGVMALMFVRYASDVHIAEHGDSQSSVVIEQHLGESSTPPAQPASTDSVQTVVESDEAEHAHDDEIEFGFVGMYMIVAWLAGFYYLISSLYNDRRDNSVLYWKSMPVSESNNVLSKFVFGSVAFCVVAIIFAWVTALLLFAIVHGMATTEELARIQQDSDFVFGATQLLIWPLLGLVLGVLWGAPIFAYVLMVSAMSKRLPFLLLVLPLVVLFVLERIVFRSTLLLAWFQDHWPSQALTFIAQSPDLSSALSLILIEHGGSLLSGLVLAAVFLSIAVWYRNQRFEI